MYEGFYRLKTDPFRLSSDHRFCFNHRSYARAKAYVEYALYRAEGFVMITGRPGTGKTTLIQDLLDSLPRNQVKAATLVSTQLGAEDLLRMTAYAFGLDSHAEHKSTVLQDLMEFLSKEHRTGHRSLLIIDEAQDLVASALEELRLLTNLQRSGQPLLQIVLVGQEALRTLVRGRALEQLHQRLVAAWHLDPLDREETVSYVRHRLERAGWTGDPVFEPGVLPIVFDFSGGVPRRINLICSRLLLHGFITERHTLTATDAELVVRDLEQEELALPPYETQDPLSGFEGAGADNEGAAGRNDAVFAEARGGDPVWSEIDHGLYPAVQAEPPEPPADTRIEPAVPATEAGVEPIRTAVQNPRAPVPSGLSATASFSTDVATAPPIDAGTPDGDRAAAAPPHIVPEKDWPEKDWPKQNGPEIDQPQPDWSPRAPRQKSIAEESIRAIDHSRPKAHRSAYLLWTLAAAVLSFSAVLGALQLYRPAVLETTITRLEPSLAQFQGWVNDSSAAARGTLNAWFEGVEPGIPESTANDHTRNPEPRAEVAPGTSSAGTPSTEVRRPGDTDRKTADDATRPGSTESASAAGIDTAGRNVGETALPSAGSATAEVPGSRPPPPSEPTATHSARAAGPHRPAPALHEPTLQEVLFHEQVLFGWDSREVDPDFAPLLNQAARVLDQFEDTVAEVIGYSDSTGPVEYNRILSRERADAVATALLQRGVGEERLRVEGRGPRGVDTAEADGDAAERPADRRVEITIRTELN